MERVSKPWLSSDLLFPLFAVGREHNRLLTTLHNFTGNVSFILVLSQAIPIDHNVLCI